MAGPAEIQEMQDWASDGLHRVSGRPAASRRCASSFAARTTASLRFGQSCIETPIKIGQRKFSHGLGTHANSEIVLHLAAGRQGVQGVRRHRQQRRHRGRARLRAVQRGDCRQTSVFRTPIAARHQRRRCRSNIALPAGTRELTLKVDATADGPSHDQADWADACIVTTRRHGSLGRRRSPALHRYGDALLVPLRRRCLRPPCSRDWQRVAQTKETQTRIDPRGELDRPEDELARERHRHRLQALPGGRVGAGVREPRHAGHAAARGGAGARCPTAHRLPSQAGPAAPV